MVVAFHGAAVSETGQFTKTQRKREQVRHDNRDSGGRASVGYCRVFRDSVACRASQWVKSRTWGMISVFTGVGRVPALRVLLTSGRGYR